MTYRIHRCRGWLFESFMSSASNAGPFTKGRCGIDDGVISSALISKAARVVRVVAFLIEGGHFIPQFELLIVGQEDQDAEGNRFAVKMAFLDDLRKGRSKHCETC